MMVLNCPNMRLYDWKTFRNGLNAKQTDQMQMFCFTKFNPVSFGLVYPIVMCRRLRGFHLFHSILFSFGSSRYALHFPYFIYFLRWFGLLVSFFMQYVSVSSGFFFLHLFIFPTRDMDNLGSVVWRGWESGKAGGGGERKRWGEERGRAKENRRLFFFVNMGSCFVSRIFRPMLFFSRSTVQAPMCWHNSFICFLG